MKKSKNFIEHIIDQDLRNGFDKKKLELETMIITLMSQISR